MLSKEHLEWLDRLFAIKETEELKVHHISRIYKIPRRTKESWREKGIDLQHK